MQKINSKKKSVQSVETVETTEEVLEETTEEVLEETDEEIEERRIGVGIDFGTVNLLVYVEGQGIIFDEPSVVAYDRDSRKVIAAGFDADNMTGKTHDKIKIVRPLRDGVISDIRAAKDLLKFVFSKVNLHASNSEIRGVLCCPSEVTQIERKALLQLPQQLGIEEVYIEEEIKSGCVGSGVDIYTDRGTMVVDIGGGSTDVGILNLGDVVLSKTLRMAGNFIDHEIIKYCKQHLKIEIGQKTAERIKIELGTLNEKKDVATMRVAGRDLLTGLPRHTEITSRNVTEVLLPIFNDIKNLMIATLKDTPPELCSDIYYDGILLNGGVSLVDHAAEYFTENLGLKVKVSSNPLTSVVLGTKVLLKTRGHFVKDADTE
ncbi:rod shape-determining protein [Mycoplasmatota bacterium zrk1]